MISTEGKSKNGKNKIAKETSRDGNILNTVKKNLLRLTVSSEADPEREN